MKQVLLAVGVALLAACTTPVTQTEISKAVYPARPSDEAADKHIRSYLAGVLKDPDSLRLECRETRKGWARQHRDRPADFGWVKPCSVNAKNSYGGYVGAQPYVFLFTVDGMKALDGRYFREFEEHVGFIE